MLRRITLYREVKHAWLAKSAGSAPVDLCTYVMHTYYTNYTYVCIYLSIYIYIYIHIHTYTYGAEIVCVCARIYVCIDRLLASLTQLILGFGSRTPDSFSRL